MVRDMANMVLAARSTDAVGKGWVGSYIKRTPDVQTRFPRRYICKRVQQEDLQVLNEWFRLVGDTFMRYGILPDDNYKLQELNTMAADLFCSHVLLIG